MITLDKLRLDMTSKLEIDKEIHFVEVRADTIEECLADAAVQLETKVMNLEYEVLEKGFKGVMGLSKKPWKLKIYQNPSTIVRKERTGSSVISEEELEEEQKIIDRDGMFYVHRFGDGIYLKIVMPIGEGKPVSPSDVLVAVRRPDTSDFDEKLIKQYCKEGTEDEYNEIGHYNHEPGGDSIFAVEVSKDEMSAAITATQPTGSGADISPDTIKQKLGVQGVVCGIDDEKINQFVDNPIYGIPYEVAHAVMPVDGRDAYIAYNFETDRSKLKLKETETGQINFKELNLIQNVVEGQALAQKIMPQRGKGGKTIMGRYLEAKNGKDINIPMGENTKLDTDGCTVLAACSGEVLLIGDKITVEPVREEKGVNIKTGNITFMGTVVVRGNVDDGFNIKAAGNVEIFGTVGNCNIDAGGYVVISQGVSGRHGALITTPKSVWVHHVENATIEAGENVVVSDSLVNSEISAMKKIIVKGKHARIVGGHLFATEEITAKDIGSPGGGTETKLEVGIDPKAKKRLMELQEQQSKLVAELDEIDKNIDYYEEQKKIRKSLPKDKEEKFKELVVQKEDITARSSEMTEEINSIQSRLSELKIVGKVNASGTVFAGTKIYVRDEKHEVKNDVKSVTFYYENHFVRSGKYDSSQVTEDVQGPEGYS